MMNKTEKTNKCREILYKYSAGQKIDDLEDFNFLISIFEGHDQWELKLGCGVDYITTGYTEYYNNKCFYIYRIDGTKTDISFVHSIKNRSERYKIKMACRYAVSEEILQFKNTVGYGRDKCPITSEILYKENTHIDHYDLTFDELFEIWLKGKDEKLLVSSLNKTIDNNTHTYFTDNNFSKDFLTFHNNNTHLRAVSKIANLSVLRKKN